MLAPVSTDLARLVRNDVMLGLIHLMRESDAGFVSAFSVFGRNVLNNPVLGQQT